MRVGLSHRKNGLLSALALSRNLSALVEDLVVDRLHPLRIQLAVVLDPLLADLAPARLHRRIVDIGRTAMDDVTRCDFVALRCCEQYVAFPSSPFDSSLLS